VGDSIYRAGFRKFVLINGHGGQPQVLEIIARDLHQRYPDVMVFPLFLWRAPNCAGDLLTPHELEFGIHAGDAETSLMLAILPDQVRQHLAQAEFPPPVDSKSCLSMEGKLPFAWVTGDLSASGVLGDPTVATAAKGDRLLTSLIDGWAQVLEDIHRFRQPQVR
jgi:creatinine amidohydrolase